MNRILALAVVATVASFGAGCVDTLQIPPKPTPAEIVRDNAVAEIHRAFGKTDVKEGLTKFLEKLGDSTTSVQVREAWIEAFPSHERVYYRTISKSLADFYWPVMPVKDGRIYVEGFRAAATQLLES